MSSFCLGGILAGFLIKRAGFRRTMFLSGLFILAGFYRFPHASNP